MSRRLVSVSIVQIRLLAQNLFDHVSRFYACEALVEAAVLVGEGFVIDAKVVKNRGVDVADVRSVFDDVISPFIGLPIIVAAFDAASGHPDAEAALVVIASC